MPSLAILLAEIGFSEHEAKAYVATLERGPASVQEIAKWVGISRATLYLALEKLGQEGLVTTSRRGKRTLYVAESPDRLPELVKKRAERLATLTTEVSQAVDDIKLRLGGEKPAIKIYEGREALKALQSDFLESNPKEYIEFGSIDAIDAIYNRKEEIVPFQEELLRRKTRGRGIFQKKARLQSAGGLNKVKQLPTDASTFFGHLMVYQNKISISTFRGKHILVIIDAGEVANMIRLFFDSLWTRLP